MGRSRPLIRLVHWKDEEVPERAGRLEAAGYTVDGEVPGTSIDATWSGLRLTRRRS